MKHINSYQDIQQMISDQVEHMDTEGNYWPSTSDLSTYVARDYLHYIRCHYDFHWGDEAPEIPEEDFWGLFDAYSGTHEYGIVELHDFITIYLREKPHSSLDGCTYEAAGVDVDDRTYIIYWYMDDYGLMSDWHDVYGYKREGGEMYIKHDDRWVKESEKEVILSQEKKWIEYIHNIMKEIKQTQTKNTLE